MDKASNLQLSKANKVLTEPIADIQSAQESDPNINPNVSESNLPHSHNALGCANDSDASVDGDGLNPTVPTNYKISVGKEHQAICPPFISVSDRQREAIEEKSECVWSLPRNVSDSDVEDFVKLAKEQHGYSEEQALSVLYWDKFDVKAATENLAKYEPIPTEWTEQDKIYFEEALKTYGKDFAMFRQMLPDKSVGSLIKFYYEVYKKQQLSSKCSRKRQE